ncbi:MAG: type II secretion system minor pseudopilin GspK [Nitrospirae bacterium]|nr:type II secretion system minor pseudopilin GspK [Nitrospirota bacterium]
MNQRGSALIITILLVTILVTFVTEFAYEVYIDTTSLSNWRNAQRASLLAKSGMAICASYLKPALNSSYTYVDKIVFPVEKDLGEGAQLVIQIEDENTKFNINSIIYPNGTANDKALASLKKLFEYFKINPELALTITDWIDPDNEPRLSDSETSAKNAFLWSVDELKLIKGMDKDIFEKISPYLTVYGDGKININTSALPVLVSLHPDITEALAKGIIDYRENAPFESTSHIGRVSGMETIGTLLIGNITVKSTSFRITARATINEATRIIESVVDQSMKIYFWREG